MKHNPAKALESIKIIIDLEKMLLELKEEGYNNIFGYCILLAIKQKVNAMEIINLIKEYFRRSKNLVYCTIGESFAAEICEF